MTSSIKLFIFHEFTRSEQVPDRLAIRLVLQLESVAAIVPHCRRFLTPEREAEAVSARSHAIARQNGKCVNGVNGISVNSNANGRVRYDTISMVLYTLPSNPIGRGIGIRSEAFRAELLAAAADVSRGGLLRDTLRYVFSDTYVFLAVRIICTRQVANCGPGFNVEFTAASRGPAPCAVTCVTTGPSRARRSYFSTSFSSLRRMTLWLVASVQFR